MRSRGMALSGRPSLSDHARSFSTIQAHSPTGESASP